MCLKEQMAIDEIAKMYQGYKMLRGKKHAKLHIIDMLGWGRSMWFDETGLNSLDLQRVNFENITFTPKKMPFHSHIRIDL